MTYPTEVEHYVTSPLRRAVVTPPEIYRSETTLGQRLTTRVEGRKFLLHSDFPVACYFDGRLVGAAGAPAFPPSMAFQFGRASLRERTVEFRFPVGFGGDPAGGLAPAVAELGRFGTCYLWSSWSDEAAPQLPVVDLLPTFIKTFVGTAFVNIPDGTLAGPWTAAQNITAGSADDIVVGIVGVNAQRPVDIWLKAAILNIEDSQDPPPANTYPYEWVMVKNSSGTAVTDVQTIFCVDQNVFAYTHYFRNYKLPIRALFAPWAAETPTLATQIFGTALGVAGGDWNAVCRWEFAYLL